MRPSARDIETTAMDWAVKLDRGLSDAEQLELERWMSQDSRRLGALARAQAGWAQADRARVFKGAARFSRERRGNPLASRRRWAAAAAVIAAFVGIRWWLDYAAHHASTAIGEVRQVPLEDGSRVTLDTGSRVDVEYQGQTRLVNLERGVALFDVAKDPLRPFVVRAGHTRVRAVGTSFLVRRSDRGEEVIVIHGTVDVWRELESRESSVRLTAHHRALASSAAVSAPQALSAPELGRATAWESGIIELTGQTLGEASVEFNRYNLRQRLAVNPALANETVVGRFQSTDPGAFAQAAAAMLKARVRAVGETLILEPDRP